MPHLESYRRGTLTRWDLFRELVRSITLGPYNPKDKTIARLFGGAPASSGISVNETTAMNYSAVWGAVNVISGSIASVPLNFYRRTGQSKELNRTHRIFRMLHDRPNPQMGSAVFRRTLQAHKLIWGNGYAEIERTVSGDPIALWPLLPFAMEPYLYGDALRYRYYQESGAPVEYDAADIIHLRGYSVDGICGVSVVQKARESLGLGVAAERFGATFFGNGSTFGGVISYPAGIGSNPQTRKENREALEKVHQGVDKAHRFLALYEGAKYERLGIPPNDAQFLETREFQIEEVCRWFNLPPHKLKHLKRATFSNIEQQAIEFVQDTLNPHWVEWEQELMMKLVSPLEQSQQLIEFNRDGLLQGDSAARGEYYSKQFSIGAISQDEIRAKDNLNPLPAALKGDIPYVPVNMMPADLARQYWEAQISKAKQPPPVPQNRQPPNQDDEIKVLREALDLARHATQLAEDARDVAKAEAEGERTAREQTRNDLDSARAEADKLGVEVLEWANELAQQNGKTEKVVAERDAALAQILTLQAERDGATIAAGEAQTAKGEAELRASTLQQSLEASTAESEGLKTDLARARSDIAIELERQATQKTVILAAMRSLFADATARLLSLEADRARQHQATPEKFRAWIDRFYALRAEYVREVFHPMVGPWTAIAGGAPNLLLERLVAAHVEASRTGLQLVADTTDPDELAANLERTLNRWERERPNAVADALVREGMEAHERS